MTNLMRANKITINMGTDGLLVGTYYLTHKKIATVNEEQIFEDGMLAITDCDGLTQIIKPDTQKEKRSYFHNYLANNSAEFGVEFSTNQAEQAWDRQYKKYFTDDQVSTDADTLVTSQIIKMIAKSKKGCSYSPLRFETVAIDPVHSDLDWIEDGRYIKDNAWYSANISGSIIMIANNDECKTNRIEIPLVIKIKSGQITKTKLSMTELNKMIDEELGLMELTDLVG